MVFFSILHLFGCEMVYLVVQPSWTGIVDIFLFGCALLSSILTGILSNYHLKKPSSISSAVINCG